MLRINQLTGPFFAAIFYSFTALLVDLFNFNFNSTKFVRSVVRSAALLVNILERLRKLDESWRVGELDELFLSFLRSVAAWHGLFFLSSVKRCSLLD